MIKAPRGFLKDKQETDGEKVSLPSLVYYPISIIYHFQSHYFSSMSSALFLPPSHHKPADDNKEK